MVGEEQRPIQLGEPKTEPTSGLDESRPPACSPITTMISTKIAPAASTAASVFQLGPLAHGGSWRGPTYAVTNRNMTITAPAYTSTCAAATNSADSNRYSTASEPRFPISASAE